MSRGQALWLAATALGATLLTGCGSTASVMPGEHRGDGMRACDGTIAVMASTGSAGATQPAAMNWARVRLDSFNAEHGSSFRIEPSDVYAEPELAVQEAKRLAADPSIVGVVGPVTSIDTEAAGPVFDAAGLAYVTPSATNVELADGHLKLFFRVVGNNQRQADVIARLIASRLDPKSILIVGGHEAYGLDLSKRIARGLKKDQLGFQRASVDLRQADYADVVAQAGSSRGDVVVLALVEPNDAQRLVDQLHAAGKNPTIVGGDTLHNINEFHATGAYVASPAPDVSLLEDGAASLRLYDEIFGDLAPFAALSDVAMEAVATAAFESCRNGKATRKGVARALPDIRIDPSVIGSPIAFDADHEVVDGRYWIYRIEGNHYREVM